MKKVIFTFVFILIFSGVISFQIQESKNGKAFAWSDGAKSYCMLPDSTNVKPVLQIDNNPFNIIPLAGTMQEAQRLIRLAGDGDDVALEKAIGILYKLSLEQPHNAPILSNLGAAFGIKAGQSWYPFDAAKYGNTSFHCLDVALEIAPDDMEVRLNRAITNWKSPSWLRRRDDAIRDIIALDKLFRENPTQRVARVMLFFEFYEILNENATDVGDWNKGKSLAENYAQW